MSAAAPLVHISAEARPLAHALALVPRSENDPDPAVRTALQPIVDLRRGRVAGYEALARFGAAGMRLPGPVLAAAASQGRGAELEALLLSSALSCRPHLSDSTYLTVNVSPQEMVSREVDRVLDQAGPLDGIVLELTETSSVLESKGIQRRLDKHRTAGAKVALDDAGAGHSGLRQLLDLRPDIVKIDRGLVTGVAEDSDRRGVVTALVTLTHHMGVDLVAEGVETSTDLHCLQDLGVDLVQGYLVGRPSLRAQDLTPAAAAVVHEAGQRRAGSVTGGLSALLRPMMGFTHRVSAALSVSNLPLPGAVVVDDHGRPRELLTFSGHLEVQSGPLVVALDEPPLAVLSRALSRPESLARTPVVVADADGRYLGLVSVTALLRQALATT